MEAPERLPNNTVIADLSRCHRQLGGSWPRTARAKRPLGRCRLKLSFQMPEALIKLNTELSPADYDNALGALASDLRYQLHLLLYRRLYVIWSLISSAICVLLLIAFERLDQQAIVGSVCIWLALQLIGIWLVAQLRKELNRMLENSVAQANGILLGHNLMLGVLNPANLWSPSDLMVPLLYFDTSQCREHIESIIRADSRQAAAGDQGKPNERTLDYSKLGLPSTNSNQVIAFAQSQLAKRIVLGCSQRWISYFDKRKLMFTDEQTKPRHLSTGKCLCQFIEEHFRNEIKAEYLEYLTTKKQKMKQKQDDGCTTEIKSQNNKLSTSCELITSQVCSRKKNQKFKNLTTVSEACETKTLSNVLNGFAIDIPIDDRENSVIHDTKVSKHQRHGSTHISLEIDDDAIVRSEDLVKKLRLLLELRADEFKPLDGSFASGYLYQTATTPRQPRGEDTSEGSGSSNGGGGWGFFSRTGGFFAGINGPKGRATDLHHLNHEQQRPDLNPSGHILEIC